MTGRRWFESSRSVQSPGPCPVLMRRVTPGPSTFWVDDRARRCRYLDTPRKQTMQDWIDRFRESVGWGDEIHASRLSDGAKYCWILVEQGWHAWVPGLLEDLPGAITLAQRVMRCPGCYRAAVVFLDKEATEYQVEEACHRLAAADVGCSFLEAGPQVLRDGLLLRMSEGTVLDRALAGAHSETS